MIDADKMLMHKTHITDDNTNHSINFISTNDLYRVLIYGADELLKDFLYDVDKKVEIEEDVKMKQNFLDYIAWKVEGIDTGHDYSEDKEY